MASPRVVFDPRWTRLGVCTLLGVLLWCAPHAAHASHRPHGAPSAQSPATEGDRRAAIVQELLRHHRHLSAQQAQQTAHALCEEGQRARIDPLFLLALIRVESNFDPKAVSPVGAQGLMQLMPTTARYVAHKHHLPWSPRRAFEPGVNVRLGARYLASLRDTFGGQWDAALTAYNRGPAATHRLLRRHRTLSSAVKAAYATRVLEAFSALTLRYEGPLTGLASKTKR